MTKSWIVALTFTFVLAPVLGSLSAACGTKRTEKLSASAGENLSLPAGSTELHGDYYVLWSWKNDSKNQNLVTFEPRGMKYFRSNLSLDKRTGTLTLGPLGIEDSGVFEGEITNGNNEVCRFTYEVSVSEPDTNSLSTGLQSNNTTQPRNHIAAAVSVCLFVAVVGVMTTCVLLVKRRNGKSQSELI